MVGDAIAEVEMVKKISKNLSILVLKKGISLIKITMTTIQIGTFLTQLDKS